MRRVHCDEVSMKSPTWETCGEGALGSVALSASLLPLSFSLKLYCYLFLAFKAICYILTYLFFGLYPPKKCKRHEKVKDTEEECLDILLLLSCFSLVQLCATP